MKSLLEALGLSAGVVSTGYAALEVAPWLVWLLPLMVCLGALTYVRGGWAAEAVPYFKATLEELSSGRLAPDLRQRLDIELQGLGTAQSRWEIVLRGADAVLVRIWGMSTWDKPALERALVVAFVYPLALLLLVWVFSGVGVLGNITVLPAEWGFSKRLFWAGFWLFAPLLVYLTIRRLARKILSNRLAQWSAFAAACTVSIIGAIDVADEMTNDIGSVFALPLSFIVLVVVSVPAADVAFYLIAGVIVIAGGMGGPFAGVYAFGYWLGIEIVNIRLQRYAHKHVLYWVIWLCCLIGAVVLLAAISPRWVQESRLDQQHMFFVALIFISLLPLFNALCDWISVGTTRSFIRRYLDGRMKVWQFLVLDGLIAVVMMLALYVGTVGLFLTMQHWGWPVDARALLAAFRADPVSPQASWVTAMAVTNLLPTLLHLSVAVVGLATGHLHGGRDTLAAAFNRLQSAGLPTPDDSNPASAGLTRREAYAVLNYLYFDRWLGALLAVSLIVALWPLLAHALAMLLAWL